jgi:2-hydroxycyclohexanecarboxyl-CoA dehydrogenase
MRFQEPTAVDLGLAENVVVVWGAARGIGAAIARAFADEAAHVAAIDRDPGVLDLASQLPESLGLVADVTDLSAVRRAAEDVAHRFGPCDHVVFAVGAGSGKFGFPFWKLEPADWELVLKVNLLGAVNVAHTFAPALAAAASSANDANTAADTLSSRSMLFLSSVAGQIGSQTDPPYSAAKAALINFAQCAAKDLAPYGVRVNTLCPGMVQTPLNRGVYEAWAREQPESERSSYEEWSADKIKKLVPLNRWQRPEDIASMAVFLASNQAQNITGQTINIDGGYVMHS